jgi:DNA (cytosine-5)-methyltransferase 1
MRKISVGSVCSGIEAASVAWRGLGYTFSWFSEIADFPSKLLKEKYPEVINLGDMRAIPNKLSAGEIEAPDLICAGTPCQAFSLAGWKKGLEDSRGNLTLKFVDIVDENDRARATQGHSSSVILWENVEGVLRDKTNAFGIFIASLAGLESEIPLKKWPQAGLIRGPKRNVAWRVLDAKYFGLPQQRRRLYLLAGGKDFFPENVLFDELPHPNALNDIETQPLLFDKQGQSIQIFREYTDCLYSAYGTKWNGNAAAYNGSLFVSQNGRLRRFTPLECERLMGFPDNYTNIPKAKPTNRYQGLGNSWAVPVIQWLGKRIFDYKEVSIKATVESVIREAGALVEGKKGFEFFNISSSGSLLAGAYALNGSEIPREITLGKMFDIIDVEAAENFYISPVGCKGILRRKEERQLSINPKLEVVLKSVSSQWTSERIEQISKKQSRGRFSSAKPQKNDKQHILF